MEHFRILLGQQKEAITKDLETYKADILKLEEDLEAAKYKQTQANKELRSITKRLEKLF